MANAILGLDLALRVVAGGTLLFAGFAKLRIDTKTRVSLVRSYRLMPEFALITVAWMLPLSEVILGVALIAGAIYPLTVPLAVLLLLAITIALGISIIRKLRIKCGCFTASKMISWSLVVRNLALIAMTILIGVIGLQGPVINQHSIIFQLTALVAVSFVVCLVALLTRGTAYAPVHRTHPS